MCCRRRSASVTGARTSAIALSTATRHTSHSRSAPVAQIAEKKALVGLDGNPKAAAVMTEAMYRAGMQDTYAKDTAHYEVITDKNEAEAAIAAAEKRTWAALPVWLRNKPLTTGYEYLNLKEK